MADNGLNVEQELVSAGKLSLSEISREETWESNAAKVYSSILSSLESDIKNSIREKDYIKLFDLEEICQKHDARFSSIETEKAIDCMLWLVRAREAFIASADPAKIRASLMPDTETLERSGDAPRIKDWHFEIAIRSIRRIISGFVGYRSSSVEKSFYETRKSALSEIKKAYQRNLDTALGFAGKGK